MLEVKSYSQEEIAKALNMKPNNQGIKRKLERRFVSFKTNGRGKNITFEINKIPTEFEFFCLTELGFAPQSDFKKVRNLYYYCFNDEEFFTMPNEYKADILDMDDRYVSSHSISKYLQKLYNADYWMLSKDKFIYYFALGGDRRMAEKSEYLEAWKLYWDEKEKTDVYNASQKVKEAFGGFPRRQPIPEINAIQRAHIKQLIELTNKSFDEEYGEDF